MQKIERTWILLLLALLITAPLSAGVVFEVETKDHNRSPPKTETTELSAEGKNLKMGIPASRGSSGGSAIFRGDRREMVVVDHDQKSYMVIDKEAIASIAGQVNSAMAQMQEALKNVPEGQRAMVEKMMKDRMPQQEAKGPLIEVRRTGEKASHAGYPCVKYDILKGGRVFQELWVTDWKNVEGGSEAAGAFKEMAGFMGEMLDSVSGAAGPGSFGQSLAAGVMASMREIDGFPVVTRTLDDDGSLENESSLKSAKRRTLDPAEFEPPSGYKRRSMFGG